LGLGVCDDPGFLRVNFTKASNFLPSIYCHGERDCCIFSDGIKDHRNVTQFRIRKYTVHMQVMTMCNFLGPSIGFPNVLERARNRKSLKKLNSEILSITCVQMFRGNWKQINSGRERKGKYKINCECKVEIEGECGFEGDCITGDEIKTECKCFNE
jgi:hypothetical protein